MPIAKLEFNLPEEEAYFENAVSGFAYRCALEDLDNWLRSMVKHSDVLTKKERKAFEDARDQLQTYMEERGLSLFE